MISDEQQVISLMEAALECSVYLAPTDPGLTHEGLKEAATRLGLRPGEMDDAFLQVRIIQQY